MQVAVIMSTYNGEKYLAEQIESILNQKNVQVELFIRDDGSTDQTINIINGYLEKYTNIHLNSGCNLGFRKSFIQELLSHEGFDFYAFSDQDDFWEKDKLLVACNAFKQIKDEPAIYYSNLMISDEKLNVYKKTKLENRKQTLESVILRRSIAGCTMLINRKMWEQIYQKNINESMLRRGHDSFIVSLCYAIGGKVIFDSSAHIRYRQHTNNTSGGMHGIRQRIKKEWNSLLRKRGQESEIAKAILTNWNDQVVPNAQQVLSSVSMMNNHISIRVKMALSLNYRTGNFALTVLGKVKIICGLL